MRLLGVKGAELPDFKTGFEWWALTGVTYDWPF